jgi:hypothetical protein
MTVSSSAAERVVDDILSSNPEILSAGVIDRSGNIIANKSSESFRKRFEGVRNLEGNRYSGTLALAALGIANEVKDAFGEPQALITIYRDCKLMLIPMPSYDVLIGLALEPSVNVENNSNAFAKEMERLLARTLKS